MVTSKVLANAHISAATMDASETLAGAPCSGGLRSERLR
jgi:hypothetical protein